MSDRGRRKFLIGASALVSAPFGAWAQTKRKMRRVGDLVIADAKSGMPIHRVFLDSLRKYGWIDGQNVDVEVRWAAGQFDQLKKFATELARLPVDVFITSSNIEAGVVRQVTTTTPIVVMLAADPVGAGFTASLAKPTKNVTGVSFDPTPQIFAKHLELLKKLSPVCARVIVVRVPSLPGGPGYWDATNIAARTLGLTLNSVAIKSSADIAPMLSALSRENGDAVFVFGDPITYGHARQIAEASLKNHLPVISTLRAYTLAGGLASYGPDFPDLVRRAAVYIDKILRGAKPADLPIEQPEKFELVLNLKSAKALGLAVPSDVLLQADQIIE